ncbi:MAG: hypothetical protein KIT31_04135 [Deltaproteobacteria bacterium]|nr:hypothetical protein [Deltaproteobacteria bacterium]
MMRILDLTAAPVLGRLHGFNRKHRLRSKHYEAIENWPGGARLDVIDAAALASRDHYTSTDALFVVGDKLKGVLASVVPGVVFHPADAGGRTVWIVEPHEDDDVAHRGEIKYSKSGYQVVRATNLSVSEPPKGAWCKVRNAPLLALGDAVLAAAAQAGVVWDPVESIAEYRPLREHPYCVATPNSERARRVELAGALPEAPASVPHPRGALVVDDDFSADANEAWTEMVHDESPERALFARYCSGLALPRVRAVLDELAKSKLKKRWKEATTGGTLRLAGVPAVDAAQQELLGAACRFTPVEMVCAQLGETYDKLAIVEPPVVEWIDWERSDVAYRRNGMYDGWIGLHPVEASYTATDPIVRVAGTNLLLVHRDVAAKLTGFYMKPLHEVSYGLNLDEYVRVT